MEQLQSKQFTIPKEFLKTLGIELEKTTLICVIDATTIVLDFNKSYR
jgi:bifunctional DNA-binding transcriptional regulator/antitoxin component of YhaV-PrlF toxin-antitoxin module